MPQVHVLPIDTTQSLDSMAAQSHTANTDNESGRRFGDEFERQLAAETSGKNNTENSTHLKKEVKTSDEEPHNCPHDKKSEIKSVEPAEIKSDKTAVVSDEKNISDEELDVEDKPPKGMGISDEQAVLESTQKDVDKNNEFLSFLSASAKLIPEDSKLQNAKLASDESLLSSEETALIESKAKPLDKLGIKLAEDDTGVQKKSSELSLSDKFSALLNAENNKSITDSNNAKLNVENQKDLLTASAENTPRLKGVEGIRNDLTQIVNSQNASAEDITDAESIIDDLLLNEGEFSAAQLKEKLASNENALKNPIVNQLVQALNDKEVIDKSSEAKFIAGNEFDESLEGSAPPSLENEKSLKNSSPSAELLTQATTSADTETTEVVNDKLVNVSDKLPPQDIAPQKVAQQDDKSVATFGITNDLQRKSSASTLASSMEQNTANSDGKDNEQNIETLIDEEGEAIDNLLTKEQKPLVSTPQVSPPILRTDSLASTPTQVIDESTRSEQSLDSLLSTIKTDNSVQMPKVLTPQPEILSMYRKDFSETLKDKVMVMVNQKIQQVDIQLDPPEMGNIHVRVNLQNEQAVVTFNVQNQQAKEALEQNMGRLKDMLSQTGVDVGDANVNQQSNNQGENSGSNGSQPGAGSHLDQSNDVMAGAQQVNLLKASSAGIDYYA